MESANQSQRKSGLTELAKLFFKLGCIGFGGPAVHIAMMEEEVVRKRNWMTHEHFLDLVGATNLIPGPNSTEMTMHCGHQRAGRKGLVVAGLCFIFPAVIITAAIAWMYKAYGRLPQVEPFLYGIKPAIISVIAALMITLGKKALKSVELGIIGTAAGALALAGFNEIILLFGAGLVGMIIAVARRKGRSAKSIFPFFILQIFPAAAEISNWKIFLVFLKIGAILYGSGYVLFAFLDGELVSKGLLDKEFLLDAIAVGQITPGPVFSSATFIGWQMAGPVGAIAATVGIFFPSFIFVALLNPVIPRLRKSKVMSAFLDAVNITAVALILVICVEMAKTSITDWRTTLIALMGFAASIYLRKLNSAFVILGGAIAGYLLWVLF